MIRSYLLLLILSSSMFASQNQTAEEALTTAKKAILARFSNINGLYEIIVGYLNTYDQDTKVFNSSNMIKKYDNSIGAIHALYKEFLAVRDFNKTIIQEMAEKLNPNLVIDPNFRNGSFYPETDIYTIKVVNLKTLAIAALLPHSEKKPRHVKLPPWTGGHVSFIDLNAIQTFTYSPNGKYLASCSQDGTIKIWDGIKLSNEPIKTIITTDKNGQINPLNRLSFSIDGVYLLYGSHFFPPYTYNALKNQAIEIEEEAEAEKNKNKSKENK